ncbi:MAG: helix-turn-helix domain-containing protein [Stackebrandtia sp.]
MQTDEPIHVLIRRLRTETGLTERQLADKLALISGHSGITANRVRRWETGERIPGPKWRHYLSLALGAPSTGLASAAKLTRLLRSLDESEPR